MQDEVDYVDRWVRACVRPDVFCETVVVVGGDTDDGTGARLFEHGVRPIYEEFLDDFAKQRNFACGKATGDWILEIDADEIPSEALLEGLFDLCAGADRLGVEVIGLPRLNFHDGELQPGVGLHGLDYQYRLHRSYCRWHGNVHEELIGWTKRIELPIESGAVLIHKKTQARYEERNAYYATLDGPET